MFKKIFALFIFIIFVFVPNSYSASNASAADSPLLDSVIRVINDPAISLSEKIKIDNLSLNEPLAPHRSMLLAMLVQEAKRENDENNLIYLYSRLGSYYIVNDSLPAARLYLDSAQLYVDKSVDFAVRGLYYHMEGNYYGSMQQDIPAHQNFHKAVENFEKTDNNALKIISLLRNMTVTYFLRQDLDGVREIIDKMNMVAITNPQDSAKVRLTINEITGGYYYTQYDVTSNAVYLDSAQIYYFDAVRVYESSDSLFQKSNARSMVTLYGRATEMELYKENTDWAFVEGAINKAKEICPKGNVLRLSIISVLEATAFIKRNELKKAEEKLTEAKHLIDEIVKEVPEYEYQYIDIYRNYISLYRARGDYNNALKYTDLLAELRLKHQKENNNRLIRELDIQYQTAEKDAQINLLQIDKQKQKQNRILIIGISILVAILLVILALYNHILKLRKENEAKELRNRVKEKEIEFQLSQTKNESDNIKAYVSGLETERERLSKELHDNVANQLLAIDIQLQGINNVPDKIYSGLENLHTEVRNISHELMPPLFKYASLLEIISDYIEKLNENKTIEINIVHNDEDISDSFSEKGKLEIYRIIQEATNNIIKHSGADHAQISFSYMDDKYLLMIEDNGKGFDLKQKKQGVGLYIINERVSSLGGEVNISAEKGNGCRINIEFPISQLTGK
jgi:Signal transduction histidine kinase